MSGLRDAPRHRWHGLLDAPSGAGRNHVPTHRAEPQPCRHRWAYGDGLRTCHGCGAIETAWAD